MTAGQIQDQHQRGKEQAEHVTELEQKKQEQQEIGAAQGAKIDHLSAHNEQLMEELKLQRDHCARLEEQMQQREETANQQEANLRREAHQIAELKDQLIARDTELKRYRSDIERQKATIKELTEGLAQQNAANDDMRERLEGFEGEQRRIHSYQSRTPDNRIGNCSYSGDVPSPNQMSARGPLSCRQDPSNGAAGYSARGSPPQAFMDEAERDAFLSHFPMAQRTERAMRNRLEGERRKKVTQR